MNRVAMALFVMTAMAPPAHADCPGEDGVLSWLKHLRSNAVEAAYDYAGPALPCEAEVLVAALPALTVEERRYVVRALGDSTHSPGVVVDALIALLADSDRTVREQATLALSKIGRPAIVALAKQLRRVDVGFPTPYGALGSNEKTLGGLPRADLRVSDYAAVALIAIGPASAEAVVEEARTGNEDIRTIARYILSKLGAPAVEAVRKLAITTADAELRFWALELALDLVPSDAGSCEKIRALLADPDAATIERAVWISHSCAALAVQVVSLMGSYDENLRNAASSSAHSGAASDHAPSAVAWISALAGASSPTAVVDALHTFRLVAEGAQNTEVRAAIRTRVVPVVQSSLREKDAEVRAIAARTAAKLGPDAAPLVPNLVELLEDPEEAVRSTALDAITELRAVARVATPKLMELLKDPATRRDMANALAAVAEPETALSALRPMLRDANTAGDVAYAIADLGPAAAAAIADLGIALRSSEAALYGVMHAYGGLGPAGLEPLLEIARTSSEPTVRVAALSIAMDNASDTAEVAAARRIALGDPDDAVRWSAAESVVRKLAAADAKLVAERLVVETDERVRSTLREALIFGGANAAPAAPILRQSLGHSHDDELALTLFAIAPDPALLPLVREVLSNTFEGDPDRVRIIMLAANQIWPALLPLLDSDHRTVLDNVFRVLMMARELDSRVVGPMRNLLQRREPHIRAAALLVLARVRSAAAPARELIVKALRDPEPLVREAAASAYEELEAADAELAYDTAAQDRYVARYFAEQMPDMIQEIRPPRDVPRSASPSTLPAFPLPPPKWSAYDLMRPSTLLGNATDTLHEVHERLSATLSALDYGEQSLFRVDGGFALATKLERIDANGRSYPVPDRWTRDRLKPTTFREYLEALFLEKPGRFRMFIFVITPLADLGTPTQEISEADAELLFESNRRTLPEEIAKLPFAGRYCHVLVYSFEKRAARVATLIRPDPLGWRAQLDAAGLRSRLGIP